MMRIINMMVIAALIFAASAVYKIKFDSTLQAEKVDKLHDAIRRERSAIADLKAKWAERDTPSRIEALANRFLKLQSVKTTQFSTLDNLPPRPPQAPPNAGDPIAALIAPQAPETTGSLPPAAAPAPRVR